MKQILITRHQLDRIIAEENGKLAGKVATEENDFMLGLAYTHYVCELSEKILNRLFGALDDKNLDDIVEWSEESFKRMLNILEEGEADE